MKTLQGATPETAITSAEMSGEARGVVDIAATTLIVRGLLSEVTLCQCLHCGNIWIPSKPNPIKCSRCHSTKWKEPRIYKIAGAPEPQLKAKPRGRAFAAGEDSRRVKRE